MHWNRPWIGTPYRLAATLACALMLLVASGCMSAAPGDRSAPGRHDDQGSWLQPSSGGRIDLTSSGQYYVDPYGTATIEEVASSAPPTTWQPLPGGRISFGLTEATYWFRFSRPPEARAMDIGFIEITNPHLNSIALYLPSAESAGRYEVRRGGIDHPFHQKELQYPSFIYEWRPAPGQDQTIYLRLSAVYPLTTHVVLWSPSALIEWASRIDGGRIFLGFMAFLGLFGTMLFLLTRDRAYACYTLYVVGGMILQLGLDGVADRYLSFGLPWLTQRQLAFGAAIVSLSILLLIRDLLHLAQSAAGLLIGWRIAFACVLLCSLLVVSPWYRLAAVAQLGLGAPVMVLSLVAGIVTWRQNRPIAAYFVVGRLGMIIGTAVTFATAADLVPLGGLGMNGMKLGSACEGMALAVAMAHSYLAMKRDVHAQLTRLTQAYSRFVPREILRFLKHDSIVDVKLGDQIQREMTVMFCDIRSFTSLSESMTPTQNFNFLNSYLQRVAPVIRRNGGLIDKYIGDAIMALFPDQPEDALRAAVEMRDVIRVYNGHRANCGYQPIRVGIGLHTGALILGTIGHEDRMESTVISDAVNLASRLESLTKLFGATVIVSEATLNQMEGPGRYAHRFLGNVQVKGKSQSVSVYEVFQGDPAELYALKLETRPALEAGVRLFEQHDYLAALAQFNKVLETNPDDAAAQLFVRRCNRAWIYQDGIEDDELGSGVA